MPALVLFGDTERSPAMRHEVPIATGDPLMFAELDGRAYVLTSWLERDRIARVLPAAELLDIDEFGWQGFIDAGSSWDEAMRETATRALQRIGVLGAVVPAEFPLALADRLRADGVELTVDEDTVAIRRRVKAGAELDGIRAAQRAAEAGMAAAASLLARAESGSDGSLRVDGTDLLAERVRSELRAACAASGAPAPPDVMVVSARSGSGHDPGSGPLPAGLPITVDLWPRHEASACWADMTRTFLVGEPAPEHAELIAAREQLVRVALFDTVAAARPGVTGRELHEAVCDRFESAGYRTQRTGPGEDPSEGFQFSLGHGVGLEVHEPPTIGLAGREPLVAGDVIAIEPGLNDRRIGGIRLEDLLLITDSGCEVLTRYPYELSPVVAGSHRSS